jgi:hypothetical protein
MDENVNLLRGAPNAEIMLSPKGLGFYGVREFQWYRVA